MADLWMLFPTEEEYLQVGARSAVGRKQALQGRGCSACVLQRSSCLRRRGLTCPGTNRCLHPSPPPEPQWFKAAGFEDVQLKRIGPSWYRGVRRHGLIMGCSVTARKPAGGPSESPLQLGPKAEVSAAANTNPLSFLMRVVLGSVGGFWYFLLPVYMWCAGRGTARGGVHRRRGSRGGLPGTGSSNNLQMCPHASCNSLMCCSRLPYPCHLAAPQAEEPGVAAHRPPGRQVLNHCVLRTADLLGLDCF